MRSLLSRCRSPDAAPAVPARPAAHSAVAASCRNRNDDRPMPGSLHELANRRGTGISPAAVTSARVARRARGSGVLSTGASRPWLLKPEAASPGAGTQHVGSQVQRRPAKPSPLGPIGAGRARMRIRQLPSGIRKPCDAAHLPFLAQPVGSQAPHTPSPHASPYFGEKPPAPRRADGSPQPFRPDRRNRSASEGSALRTCFP